MKTSIQNGVAGTLKRLPSSDTIMTPSALTSETTMNLAKTNNKRGEKTFAIRQQYLFPALITLSV